MKPTRREEMRQGRLAKFAAAQKLIDGGETVANACLEVGLANSGYYKVLRTKPDLSEFKTTRKYTKRIVNPTSFVVSAAEPEVTCGAVVFGNAKFIAELLSAKGL